VIFFFISKVLPFRDLRISLSFKGRISSPETFANLIVAILFLFRCCICIFFSPVSACVLTQSCILPVTHAAKHTTTQPSTLLHMRHAQPDSWHRPPGGEDGARSGRFVGGDEPGSSALSPDSHTQWVHSHTHVRLRGRLGEGLIGGALSSRRTADLWWFVVHLSSKFKSFSFLHFVVM